ncbi:MAG: hypothetical protein M3478_16255 [Planctomycetota bacterium]|nr:hypothetical protein [Planctomycetota bacterium]
MNFLGEFQPSKMVMVDDRQVRMPDGDAITGYFPAVVGQELYYKAQASRRTRQRTGGQIQSTSTCSPGSCIPPMAAG